MPYAMAERPPGKVPRSCMPVADCHMKACVRPPATELSLSPTTCPTLLMPHAKLFPPARLPQHGAAPASLAHNLPLVVDTGGEGHPWDRLHADARLPNKRLLCNSSRALANDLAIVVYGMSLATTIASAASCSGR